MFHIVFYADEPAGGDAYFYDDDDGAGRGAAEEGGAAGDDCVVCDYAGVCGVGGFFVPFFRDFD